MLVAEQEVQALEAIEDPIERSTAALHAIEEARVLMSELAKVRSRSVADASRRYGASKAARLLGTSRHNMYRVISNGLTPEERSLRGAEWVAILRFPQSSERGSAIDADSNELDDQSSDELVTETVA